MRFYPFLFLLDPKAENWKIHQLRDGSAMSNLISAYEAFGMTRMPERINSTKASWPDDVSDQDVFLVATRLPLSDDKRESRKVVQRSGSPVENAMLNRTLAYFTFLDRRRVLLTHEMALALDPCDRADASYGCYRRGFSQLRDYYGVVDEARRPLECVSSWRTAGYVICDQLWVDGPFFQACFGMDGATTLAFCYLLRTRHSDLLDGKGMSMVELFGMIPPEPDSIAVADEWESRVLLDRVATTTRPPATVEEACRLAPPCGPSFAAALRGEWTPTPSNPAAP